MKKYNKLISSLALIGILFTSVNIAQAQTEQKEFNYTFVDRGSIVATGSAVSGGAIETPSLEREGYDLSWDKDIESITTNTVINSVWTKKKFPVTFFNDGTVVKTQMVEYGDNISLPSLYKRGYTLTWDNNGQNIIKDTSISAIWTINTYNINYQLDGGINNPKNPVTYTYGQEVKFEKPTKKGYLFNKWTMVTSENAISANASIVKLPPQTIGDQTVKANWTKVNVPKVKYTKVKRSKDNKKVNIKYKKVTGVKNYTVQISTNKKFKKAKTKTTKKTNVTFTKLNKNKKYYVRIRTYKKDSTNKKVYSKWSVKTIKK